LEVEHGIIELLCPGCEKTGFPDRQTLRRHVKTYHGVKLPCEFCGKFFNEGNKMRRHVIEGKLTFVLEPVCCRNGKKVQTKKLFLGIGEL
jgi:uncharacterized C2H2 Zn-finger protein